MLFFRRIFTYQTSVVLRMQSTLWPTILIKRGARENGEIWPSNEETERYLRDRFQVPKKSARLLSKVCQVSDIDERVQYFYTIGLTEESIRLVFKKFPRAIMTCEVEAMDKRVKFLSEYTRHFKDPSVLITHLIPQYPILLSHPVHTMRKRIHLLEKCDLTKEEIAKVLR